MARNESHTEEYFRKKKRDQTFARWFVFLLFGLPLAIAIGAIIGS